MAVLKSKDLCPYKHRHGTMDGSVDCTSALIVLECVWSYPCPHNVFGDRRHPSASPLPALSSTLCAAIGLFFLEAVCPVPTVKPNDQQLSCLTASRMLTFAHSNDSSKSIFFKKALGMKEICFTAKHAGGFTMWPSNFTPYVRAEED